MHQLNRVVVRADSEEQAIERAAAAFEYGLICHRDGDCTGYDGDYDYFYTLDESGARWSDRPAVLPAHTEEGRDAIYKGWSATYDDLVESIQDVMDACENAEFASDLVDDLSARLSMVGCWAYSTPTVHHYLFVGEFDEEGDVIGWSPIATGDEYRRLDDALIESDGGRWVVLIDGHF